jgi:hypothetical protein
LLNFQVKDFEKKGLRIPPSYNLRHYEKPQQPPYLKFNNSNGPFDPQPVGWPQEPDAELDRPGQYSSNKPLKYFNPEQDMEDLVAKEGFAEELNTKSAADLVSIYISAIHEIRRLRNESHRASQRTVNRKSESEGFGKGVRGRACEISWNG